MNHDRLKQRGEPERQTRVSINVRWTNRQLNSANDNRRHGHPEPDVVTLMTSVLDHLVRPVLAGLEVFNVRRVGVIEACRAVAMACPPRATRSEERRVGK